MMDQSFLENLASSAPTPGGGGASAAVGAIAAALSSMVGELTIGKRRYADVQEEVLGCLGRLAILRSRLIELIDEDADAFLPLANAYKMPSATEQERNAKSQAMQQALAGACDVPLEIMRACEDVLVECDALSICGSKMAISDAGASAILADAAARAASLNVMINIASMEDDLMARQYRDQAESLLGRIRDRAHAIADRVNEEIGA